MKGRATRHWNPDLGLAILAATSEPPHNREVIAAYMGVSRERVRQIEERALKRLRLYMEKALRGELANRNN